MKPVLADTSYYLAFLIADDAHHNKAVEIGETLLGRIIVTEYVLVELGNALAKSKGRAAFVPFVQGLLANDGIEFIPASSRLFHDALELYASRPDKNWSLVDCTSFVVMKQRRLRAALTADHHFAQAGFTALLT